MKKEYIAPTVIFTAVLLLTIANIAYASESHHDDGKDGVDGKDGAMGLRGKDGINGLDAENTTNGTASAIAASQLHFDWSTNALQAGIGVGSYDGSTAFSFGLGQRFSKTLISGSVSTQEGKYSFGAGLNFHF